LKPGLVPAAFNLRTVPDLIAGQRSDPWEEMLGLRQALPETL
jgi:DNA primase